MSGRCLRSVADSSSAVRVAADTDREQFDAPAELHGALRTSNDFHPLGRIGTPLDVANVAALLLSPQAGRVTGAVREVEGGVMVGRNQPS